MTIEDLQRRRELYEINRESYEYLFKAFLHLDSKNSNIMSIILVSETILVTLIGVVSKQEITSPFLMVFLILISLAGSLLMIAGWFTLKNLMPETFKLPSIITPDNLEGDVHIRQIEELIRQNHLVIEERSERLDKITLLVKISIVFMALSIIMGILNIFLSQIESNNYIIYISI